MDGILGMIPCVAKFCLWICETRQQFASIIQWWDQHSMVITDIHFSRTENIHKKRVFENNLKSQQAKFYLKPEILLCGLSLFPLDQRLHLRTIVVIFFFFHEG